MNPSEALEVLNRYLSVPNTNRVENLSYEQVEIRNAFRVLRDLVESSKWSKGGERQMLSEKREFDA
jgi:hypothetical protein